MSSSIPAARANLYSMLVSAFASVSTLAPTEQSAVQVHYGMPDAHPEYEIVALVGWSDVETRDVTLGPDAEQEETYNLDLRIQVWRPDTDGSQVAELQALETQAWLFYDTIRAAVQADRTLGGAMDVATVAVATPESGVGELSPVPMFDGTTPAGWASFVGVQVRCMARIT